uniref:Innexin n=1 Tax=Ditylenchus dipsaci TaxID=166011 RepID=A0A915EFK5_9BILA
MDDVIKDLKSRGDDEFVDRLHYSFTSRLLCTLSGIWGCIQLWSAVECWTPAQMTDTAVDYTETYCFSDYLWPWSDMMPLPSKQDQQASKLAYYPWIFIVLLMQSFTFIMPIVDLLVWICFLTSKSWLVQLLYKLNRTSFERSKITKAQVSVFVQRHISTDVATSVLLLKVNKGSPAAGRLLKSFWDCGVENKWIFVAYLVLPLIEMKLDEMMTRFSRLKQMLGEVLETDSYSLEKAMKKNNPEDEAIDMEQLRKDCWLGIPNTARPLAWRILCGYSPTIHDLRDRT